jgi:hypothetical protein
MNISEKMINEIRRIQINIIILKLTKVLSLNVNDIYF